MLLTVGSGQFGEIVAKRSQLRCFANQPVAEIVQCGEPISSISWRHCLKSDSEQTVLH
jgi:hypothetical protein